MNMSMLRKRDKQGKVREYPDKQAVTIALDMEDYNRLKEMAQADERPVSAYVRRLLREHFAKS